MVVRHEELMPMVMACGGFYDMSTIGFFQVPFLLSVPTPLPIKKNTLVILVQINYYENEYFS